MDPGFHRFSSPSKCKLGGVEEGVNRLLRPFVLAYHQKIPHYNVLYKVVLEFEFTISGQLVSWPPEVVKIFFCNHVIRCLAT